MLYPFSTLILALSWIIQLLEIFAFNIEEKRFMALIKSTINLTQRMTPIVNYGNFEKDVTANHPSFFLKYKAFIEGFLFILSLCGSY